jgi:hypothetical protein
MTLLGPGSFSSMGDWSHLSPPVLAPGPKPGLALSRQAEKLLTTYWQVVVLAQRGG